MQKYFDKMLSNYEKPSKVALGILNFEDEHKLKFVKTYTGFVENFEHAIELLCNTMFIMNYISKSKEVFPEHRLLQWIIIKNNIASFYSAYDRLSSGFYTDSMSLIRGLYESVIRMYFISYNPDSKEAIFGNTPGEVIKGRIKLNITSFVKENFSEDGQGDYFFLSTFAHSNNFGSVQDYIKFNTEEQNEPYLFGLEWNDKLNEIGINYICFILWNYIYFIKEIILQGTHIEELNKIQPNFYENLCDTEKAFSILLSLDNNSNPEFKFEGLYNESLAIIEKIKIKEKLNNK